MPTFSVKLDEQARAKVLLAASQRGVTPHAFMVQAIESAGYQAGKDIAIALDVAASEFFDKGVDTYNVIAEIKGTKRPEEVVMIGAHLDSWHGATGATDNAAGSANSGMDLGAKK